MRVEMGGGGIEVKWDGHYYVAQMSCDCITASSKVTVSVGFSSKQEVPIFTAYFPPAQHIFGHNEVLLLDIWTRAFYFVPVLYHTVLSFCLPVGLTVCLSVCLSACHLYISRIGHPIYSTFDECVAGYRGLPSMLSAAGLYRICLTDCDVLLLLDTRCTQLQQDSYFLGVKEHFRGKAIGQLERTCVPKRHALWIYVYLFQWLFLL